MGLDPNCASLYLPIRPSRDVVGKYYQKYYTHSDGAGVPNISGISVRSNGAKKLANSWRNFKYGSRRPSLGGVGVAAALALPPLRAWIEAECRHLPTERSKPLHVLDVGHGDGRFLRFVQEIGHQASGVEIDPKAVEQARNSGLNSHQGDIDTALSIWGDNSFDYVTMSHVIEHVYEPRHVLSVASRLLRPGGKLWIECPNPRAQGLAYFGDRWRDLDPPRHICIPSFEALCAAAEACGLVLAQRHNRPFIPFEVYPFSAAARGGTARSGYWKAVGAELGGVFRTDRREWLTLTFAKPAT